MYCACGCGGVTPLATATRRSAGRVKGQHTRFIKGHNVKIRFEDSYVEEPSGCWVWKKFTYRNGYGQHHEGGRRVLAHRASFERHVRPLRPGEHVLHTCDNPTCVNPQHLRVGTQDDNLKDMALKGRAGFNSYRKLEVEELLKIEQLTRSTGLTNGEIADMFGCSASYVSLIRNGKVARLKRSH